MDLFSKYKVVEQKKLTQYTDTKERMRRKFLSLLNKQKNLIEKVIKGEPLKEQDTVFDPKTGREKKVTQRRWWWSDSTGSKFYFQPRYGNGMLEMEDGKTVTFELKSHEEVLKVIDDLVDATKKGELDYMFAAVVKQRMDAKERSKTARAKK